MVDGNAAKDRQVAGELAVTVAIGDDDLVDLVGHEQARLPEDCEPYRLVTIIRVAAGRVAARRAFEEGHLGDEERPFLAVVPLLHPLGVVGGGDLASSTLSARPQRGHTGLLSVLGVGHEG